MKTISVIIPTYKNRGALENSIDSVLAQNTDRLLEVIIVDDNNPQNSYRRATEELMSKYSDNNKVKYIQHDTNRNGATARNTGIKASSGDFIAFLDDDDIFLASKLSKQAKYLDGNPKMSAVYCFACRREKIISNQIIEGDGSRDILLLQSHFFTPSLMFRRESLISINGFDETFSRHQDYELLLRFFAAGYKIGCVPEVLIELGRNQGENILNGKKINELKSYYFEKFASFIAEEDKKSPGFANVVYAKHYAGVFLNHIKNKNFKYATDVLFKYFNKSPIAFSKVIANSIKAHLKRKA